MNILPHLLLIIIASLILVKTVTWFIEATTKISQYFKISGYTVSFLLVAIATSLPETVVSVTSGLNKTPILSYGAALGSNIALFTLVIALAGFLSKGKGIGTQRIFKTNDVYFSCILALIAVALALDGEVSRVNGILLIIGYVFYAIAFIRKSTLVERIVSVFEPINIYQQLLIFFSSLGLLVISSRAMVFSAIQLSKILEIGMGFIGLTITAVGTSLPEIAYSIQLVRKDQQEEILGNVIGSVAANSTLVLGTAALIYPIKIVNGGISVVTYAFSVVAALLFLGFTKTKQKLEMFESILLMIVYIGFVLAEYFIK
jgi:cation:H+ antiporter